MSCLVSFPYKDVQLAISTATQRLQNKQEVKDEEETQRGSRRTEENERGEKSGYTAVSTGKTKAWEVYNL